jgi:anti-sigma regulatory factor (Ser/Thr protein kinase)
LRIAGSPGAVVIRVPVRLWYISGLMTAHRTFPRSYGSIPEIFAFTADSFARMRVDPALLRTIDLVVEELFTNILKYSTMSDAAVRIDLTKVADGVEVTLTDYDVEPFDITRAPDADVGLPIERREPGGLGLHLVRRLVDSIEYEYSKEGRQSRITVRKTRRGTPAQAPGDAGDAGAQNPRE